MGIINQLIFFSLTNIKTVILDWLFQLELVLKNNHRLCSVLASQILWQVFEVITSCFDYFVVEHRSDRGNLDVWDTLEIHFR